MKKVSGELLRAIENGDLTSAERSIRKGANPNGRDERGIPPLFHAARRVDERLVSTLIRLGADPQAVEPAQGQNALGYLLRHRPPGVAPDRLVKLVKLLIAQGLRPEQRPSPAYVSPWWQAVGDHGCTDVVRAMLESGVDPNMPLVTETNYTPLMEAATKRCVETVRLLLKAGAIPTAATTTGYTAARLMEEPDTSDPEWDNWSPEATSEVLRLLRG